MELFAGPSNVNSLASLPKSVRQFNNMSKWLRSQNTHFGATILMNEWYSAFV